MAKKPVTEEVLDNPVLVPVPVPHPRGPGPGPQVLHAAVRDSTEAGKHFLSSQSQAAICLLLTNPLRGHVSLTNRALPRSLAAPEGRWQAEGR